MISNTQTTRDQRIRRFNQPITVHDNLKVSKNLGKNAGTSGAQSTTFARELKNVCGCGKH
mgnify:FL=1|jgi:hypothetical protein